MKNPRKTQLPGHGRPLNYTPLPQDPDFMGYLFPNVLNSTTFNSYGVLPLTTRREFLMLQLMNTITDKVDWNIKINRPEIAAKWTEEALSSGADITIKIVDWCLAELRHKASLIPEGSVPPPIVVYNGDVVKSDSALPVDFKAALQNTVNDFEKRIPERLKDWHPGTDKKVWDLVHPSLFPLIYGRTRILENGEITNLEDCIERCGEGTISRTPDEAEASVRWKIEYVYSDIECAYSRKFQWLPCEVDISQDKSRITSYINNLHPLKEKPLYRLIEGIIDACIPLWNLTLAPVQPSGTFYHQLRIEYFEVEYPPKISESQSISKAPASGAMDVDTCADESMDVDSSLDESTSDNHDNNNNDDADDNDDDGDYNDGNYDSEGSDPWEINDSKVPAVQPEPADFSPLLAPPEFSLKEKYSQRGLQIIVKLANIELTPDNPEYEGGSWHVEGQMNEHIVATAIYYYSSSNITSSTLSFRQWSSMDDVLNLSYPQFHTAWLDTIYGCQNEGHLIQEVGSVKTSEGRLLTFPNTLQHRVNPFRLADPLKPGHRKIIALFLVDPNIKTISTAHVPCQRQDWWLEVIQGAARNIQNLPQEVQDFILDEVNFPLSFGEAKDLRAELMDERKGIQEDHTEAINENFYVSLCEH